jgi:hypothetical protein
VAQAYRDWSSDVCSSDLNTNSTAAVGNTGVENYISAYNSDGYTIAAGTPMTTENPFASWTFRKASKFFDVVTYTGNGVAGRQIAHNLGSVPGMIIVKRTNTTGDWQVYHRSLGNTQYAVLNTTAAALTTANRWNNTTPTSSVFSLGDNGSVNFNGSTYVAYLFAHDAGGFGEAGTDNVISCGSFTADSSNSFAPTINLGFEPQYVLLKKTNTAEEWFVFDTMRGLNVSSIGQVLNPNSSNSEGQGGAVAPNATGFKSDGYLSGTYIYMAIRRPMKVPTTGTEVFSPVAYSGDGTSGRSLTTLSAIDASIIKWRASSPYSDGWSWSDRLRGIRQLASNSTDAESSFTDHLSQFGPNQNTVLLGNGGTVNGSGITYIQYALRRAPNFFDIVCDTGTAANKTVAHNLGVAPEFIIRKERSGTGSWICYHIAGGATKFIALANNATFSTFSGAWNNTTPTSSVFSVGDESTDINQNGQTYVNYLFASLAGVSKVGSYTGNGSSQTINCGFSSGARFVLIKRTDSFDETPWYVWDTARGIVSGNDPYLIIHSTAAEVTSNDSVDPDSSGFVVNQLSATNINVSSASYIFLAIA